ncbi:MULTISPECIES: NGG1p interacting factor 3 protein, NIF3 [Thermodesulfovibrio]|uniref:NGG1p interacting factor 3 protein, NIF3 n=1 Tax=Thermodesulfovibrio TaxID=28261 RepID=UPI0003F99FC4|nr:MULTISPECIES: NGG1p interacting factor 3 protein, NIF3 [Thermodesulfovibrio]MBC7190575.1 NGG1p interacting factor NIF3 [Candidatus Aerophobetes bacterium]MDI6864203.1 NGG1p interacting factor NIF3 [Thermodesulfovibrio yellowstonii]
MKLIELYKKAIQTGIENDPRGKEVVLKELEKRKKDYEGIPDKKKEFFDTESLENPYSDSRILFGTGDEEIKTIIAGIDMEVGELVLADSLRKNGTQVDLVLSHHPEGGAYARLFSVMYMQADILGRFGVPINIAESLMEGRIKEVERRLMPVNHTRAVDAARLLNIPFMCLHTPADNMVATYLQKLFDEKKPYTLDDVIELLLEIPEYRDAEKNNAGPKILIGSKERKAGKIFVDMTGGTEGSKDIFQSMALSGINTVVAMHLSEDHRKEAEKNHINVVIAGHIASDTVGLNLLLDKITEGEDIKILECSGFKRIKRH